MAELARLYCSGEADLDEIVRRKKEQEKNLRAALRAWSKGGGKGQPGGENGGKENGGKKGRGGKGGRASKGKGTSSKDATLTTATSNNSESKGVATKANTKGKGTATTHANDGDDDRYAESNPDEELELESKDMSANSSESEASNGIGGAEAKDDKHVREPNLVAPLQDGDDGKDTSKQGVVEDTLVYTTPSKQRNKKRKRLLRKVGNIGWQSLAGRLPLMCSPLGWFILS